MKIDKLQEAQSQPAKSSDRGDNDKAALKGAYALTGERLAQQHANFSHCVPLSLHTARALTNDLLAVMFPHFAKTSCRFELAEALAKIEASMTPLIACALPQEQEGKAIAITQSLLLALPDISAEALQDAEALLAGDPAAKSLDEVILAYPGFYAVAVYRLAHFLHGHAVPIIPRMMTEAAHQHTGIDIHPGAKIGRAFYIDHGTGVVIGETTVIGNNVKLYQGVTLGGYRVDKSDEDAKRHPTLEDNVTVFAGATILGGDTIVGANSIIGGNVWLTRSVPAWSRVMFRSCDREEIIPLASRQNG